MLQTHSSYDGRISPGVPFVNYLWPKPKPQPFGGSRRTGVPAPPRRKNGPRRGAAEAGFEPTH